MTNSSFTQLIDTRLLNLLKNESTHIERTVHLTIDQSIFFFSIVINYFSSVQCEPSY